MFLWFKFKFICFSYYSNISNLFLYKSYAFYYFLAGDTLEQRTPLHLVANYIALANARWSFLSDKTSKARRPPSKNGCKTRVNLCVLYTGKVLFDKDVSNDYKLCKDEFISSVYDMCEYWEA